MHMHIAVLKMGQALLQPVLTAIVICCCCLPGKAAHQRLVKAGAAGYRGHARYHMVILPSSCYA